MVPLDVIEKCIPEIGQDGKTEHPRGTAMEAVMKINRNPKVLVKEKDRAAERYLNVVERARTRGPLSLLLMRAKGMTCPAFTNIPLFAFTSNGHPTSFGRAADQVYHTPVHYPLW